VKNIYVTKSYLPDKRKYEQFIDSIWENNQLTNQGPLLKELESKLQNFLDVKNFHFVTNGTVALQIALKSLEICDGDIITTPFSYVATVSSILWERCKPVFVDIEPQTFCIDVNKIEDAITSKTKAILAVHVFGYSCNVDRIKKFQQSII
jgi:dTDP-4-amino-4,6-dideoxygalactose transaminase